MVEGLVTYQVGLPVPTVAFGVTAWIAWTSNDEREAAALVVVPGAQCLWAASTLTGSLLAGTELAVVAGVPTGTAGRSRRVTRTALTLASGGSSAKKRRR